MVTAAYMLGYGLFQLPASFLGIRLGSGRVLLGAMALMSVGALLPCLLASAPIWVASRFILGAAGAAVLPLSVHLLTQAMSGARLVKGLGVAISGWGMGMTLVMLGAASLLHLFGSRTVMLASAALGLAVVAGLKWALPHSSRAGDRAASPNLLRLLREFGANRAVNIADAFDDVMQRGGADRGRSDSSGVAEASNTRNSLIRTGMPVGAAGGYGPPGLTGNPVREFAISEFLV